MVYINVVINVKSESDIEEIRGLLAEQRRESLKEPGCARFEVYHSQSNRSVFVLVERWESQAALDVHRTAKAYTTIYAPKVLPKVDRVGHPCELIE